MIYGSWRDAKRLAMTLLLLAGIAVSATESATAGGAEVPMDKTAQESVSVGAWHKTDAYEAYIIDHCDMAVEQMEAFGIPASITLAQGLLESAAGRSTLAREGRNHFGIKCHREWQGETMLRDDDAPDECFRVYHTVAESYEDHSRFLKRKRYESLFELKPDDYVGWAKGLKKCGYATDPNYADRLITIIETYGLYAFDSHADKHAEETAAYIHEILSKTHPVLRSNGLYYVIARPGDRYGDIATELKIKKRKLLQYNDVKKDGEIKAWEEVYLQEKPDCANTDMECVTIGDGETMHSISQRFAIKLDRLRALNQGALDQPGEILRLRQAD